MPIGTSTGEYYEDEQEMILAETGIMSPESKTKITITPMLTTEDKLMSEITDNIDYVFKYLSGFPRIDLSKQRLSTNVEDYRNVPPAPEANEEGTDFSAFLEKIKTPGILREALVQTFPSLRKSDIDEDIISRAQSIKEEHEIRPILDELNRRERWYREIELSEAGVDGPTIPKDMLDSYQGNEYTKPWAGLEWFEKGGAYNQDQAIESIVDILEKAKGPSKQNFSSQKEEFSSEEINNFLRESGIIIPPITSTPEQIDPFNIGMSEAKSGKDRYQLWPERLVRQAPEAILKTVQTLKDVMDGKIPATEGVGLEAIVDVAGMIGTGGLATAPARAGVGTFGGVVGLKNMPALQSKAGRESLQEAQLMMGMWEHPDDIWKKTGWFLDNRDGRWKFEIPDAGAQIKNTTPTQITELTEASIKNATRLEEVLDHPLLYKIYPHLKDATIVLDSSLPENALAAYRTINKTGNALISVDPKIWKPDHEATTAILLHEIQHAIQKEEKFGKGSSYAVGASEAEKKAYHNAPGEIEARNVENRFLEYAITGQVNKEHPRRTQDVERHTLRKEPVDREGHPKGWSSARLKDTEYTSAAPIQGKTEIGYVIIDRQTGNVVSDLYRGNTPAVRSRVNKRIDKLDNDYGGYRYSKRYVYSNE